MAVTILSTADCRSQSEEMTVPPRSSTLAIFSAIPHKAADRESPSVRECEVVQESFRKAVSRRRQHDGDVDDCHHQCGHE